MPSLLEGGRQRRGRQYTERQEAAGCRAGKRREEGATPWGCRQAMRAGARPWVIKSDGRVSRGRHPAIDEGGGYLLFRFRSTIGVAGFNFSVRNGKRWSPRAITTLVLSQSGCWLSVAAGSRCFCRARCRGWEKGSLEAGCGSLGPSRYVLFRSRRRCLSCDKLFLGKGFG